MITNRFMARHILGLASLCVKFAWASCNNVPGFCLDASTCFHSHVKMGWTLTSTYGLGSYSCRQGEAMSKNQIKLSKKRQMSGRAGAKVEWRPLSHDCLTWLLFRMMKMQYQLLIYLQGHLHRPRTTSYLRATHQ